MSKLQEIRGIKSIIQYYGGDILKKLFLALATILSITILSCCIHTISVNETEPSNEHSTDEVTSENTTVDTTTPDVPSSSETPESTTTSEPPTTFRDSETTSIASIVTEGPIAPNSFGDHGKELIVYGDIDANDTRVLTLQDTLINYDKNISLIAWRKDGTRAVSYNTSQTYFSACTIKIGFILNCCRIIDSGAVDENTLLTYEEKHYHDGSGKIKNSEFGSQYDIKTLINLCLSISDNIAYEMLADYFGMTQYNAMIEALGCNSLKLKGIWASNVKVKDYIVIWNEVYNYFESGAKMSGPLKNACTNTPFNYGTETLDGIDYSHKSGDNFGASAVYNDAGIVWEDNSYIYAVFTNSEGTKYDIDTVNTAMDLVYQLMK